MNRNSSGLFWITPVVLILFIFWLFAPKIAITIQEFAQAGMPACSAPIADNSCELAFAKLGQTGDLFGVISSLFSGVALLAVALTLWVDARSRRHSRKPLVVCQISDDKPVKFDEPSTSNPRAIRISFDLAINALNDVAMNVSISAKVQSGSWSKTFEDFSLPIPLVPSELNKINASFALRLDDDDIRRLLRSLGADPVINLNLCSAFTSLEEVRWHTSMAYMLTFRPTDLARLLALDGDAEQCAEMWSNQVVVQADATVRQGSWKHYR